MLTPVEGTSRESRAKAYAALVIWLLVCTVAPQMVRAAAEQAPASQPTPPSAYLVNLNDMLLYDVNITSRLQEGLRARTEIVHRRDVCVFSIEQGALTLYIGTIKPKKVAKLTPPDELDKTARPIKSSEMIWARRQLPGVCEFVKPNLVRYTPSPQSPRSYVFLPLPPQDTPPGRRFAMSFDDPLGEPDRPRPFSVKWSVRQNGTVSVTARLVGKPTRNEETGSVRQLTIEYRLDRQPGAVAFVREVRVRTLGTAAAGKLSAKTDQARNAQAQRRTSRSAKNRGLHRRRSARGGTITVSSAAAEPRETLVFVARLAKVRTLEPDVRREFVEGLQRRFTEAKQGQQEKAAESGQESEEPAYNEQREKGKGEGTEEQTPSPLRELLRSIKP